MDVIQKYNVEKLPTFVFLKNGKEIDRLEKGTQVGLETKMEQYAASNDPNFFKTCLKWKNWVIEVFVLIMPK